jgi:hypothetical protein
MNKYHKITRSGEPSIIGVTDACSQVKISDKSFVSSNEKTYFEKFVNDNNKNLQRVSMGSFEVLDLSKISMLNLYKTKKRVKEVDIMEYMPQYLRLDFIFSKKLLDTIEKYKLSDYNRIRVL